MEQSENSKTLLDLLLKAKLVTPQQIEECRTALGDDVNAETVAKRLCDQGTITRWQLKQIAGGHTNFYLDNDRYLILSEIARGGMGAVFHARHIRMNRDVALKVIASNQGNDRQIIDRFKREVDVCSRLQHEHIVQTLDVGEQGGTMFLVMELVVGSPLSALVTRDGPMAAEEAAAICLQAASGLAYAHSQGIIHRDIKPSNVLLSTAGTTKILDMGLARIVEETDDATATGLTQDGTVMGTVDFMAPEQAGDAHSADARADIYSLGATLYFLLTGRVPFPGRTTIKKLHGLANEQPQAVGQLRPDCPRELVEIIERMMAKNPAERYSTAEDVARALSPLAAERIAGRPVATLSVQSAAETYREPGAEVTVEFQPPSILVDLESATAFSSSRSRKGSNIWIWGGAAAAIAVVVGIAAAFAIFNNGVENPGANKSTGEGNSVATQPGGPPTDVRLELPGHYGGIWSIAWSPDGSLLATGGGDGNICVWISSTGRRAQTLRGHHSAVLALDWSKDGKRLVSGDYYGNVRVWWAMSGIEVASAGLVPPDSAPKRYPSSIQSVAFHPNGKEVAYASGGTIFRWSLAEKKPVWSVNADAKHLMYSATEDALVGSTQEDQAIVWDTKIGEPQFQTPHSSRIGDASFMKDGRLGVVRSGKVELWDWQQKRKTGDASLPDGSTAVQFRANGWNVVAGQRLSMLSLPVDKPVEHTINKFTITGRWRMSPRGDMLAYATLADAATSPLYVSRSVDGGRLFRVNGNAVPIEVGPYFGHWMPQAPSNDHVMLMIDPHIWYNVAAACFDLTDARPIGGTPSSACWMMTEGGSQYALHRLNKSKAPPHWFGVAERLGETEPFPLNNSEFYGTMNFTLAARYGLHRARDGEVVWAIDRELKRLRLWNAANGEVLRTISIDHGRWIWGTMQFPSGPQIVADGSVIALAYDDQKIRVWRDGEDPALVIDSRVEGGHKMLLSPDGRTIAALPAPSRVELWDTESGERKGQFQVDHFGNVDLRFSDSSRYLLTSRQLWDLSQPSPQKVWECPELDHAVGRVGGNRGGDIFPDERHVIVGQDGHYQIWNWRKNKKLASIFPLPKRNWFFFNHLTGHYRDSDLAFQNVRFPMTDQQGKTEWLKPFEYEKRTGWKNDPAQAGLDLSESKPKTAANR